MDSQVSSRHTEFSKECPLVAESAKAKVSLSTDGPFSRSRGCLHDIRKAYRYLQVSRQASLVSFKFPRDSILNSVLDKLLQDSRLNSVLDNLFNFHRKVTSFVVSYIDNITLPNVSKNILMINLKD